MQNEDTAPTHETLKQQSRTPTMRASRAPWLAALVSATACALPLLLTGGIAAGVSALIDGWLVFAVTVAVGIVSAGVLLRRRRRESSC